MPWPAREVGPAGYGYAWLAVVPTTVVHSRLVGGRPPSAVCDRRRSLSVGVLPRSGLGSVGPRPSSVSGGKLTAKPLAPRWPTPESGEPRTASSRDVGLVARRVRPATHQACGSPDQHVTCKIAFVPFGPACKTRMASLVGT